MSSDPVQHLGPMVGGRNLMNPEQLALVTLVTAALKARGWRYLATIEDGAISIRM